MNHDNPTTRPMDEPLQMDEDVPPVAGMRVGGNGHSITQRTDQSNNKTVNWNDWGPWVAMLAFFVGISMGLGLAAFVYAGVKTDNTIAELRLNTSRATVSENHWRDIEVDVKTLQNDVERLKQEIANGNRR